MLKLEQVSDVILETIGPEMRACFGVDRTRIDSQAVLVALNQTFEHIMNIELLADLLRVDDLAFAGEGGVAGGDETIWMRE